MRGSLLDLPSSDLIEGKSKCSSRLGDRLKGCTGGLDISRVFGAGSWAHSFEQMSTWKPWIKLLRATLDERPITTDEADSARRYSNRQQAYCLHKQASQYPKQRQLEHWKVQPQQWSLQAGGGRGVFVSERSTL